MEKTKLKLKKIVKIMINKKKSKQFIKEYEIYEYNNVEKKIKSNDFININEVLLKYFNNNKRLSFINKHLIYNFLKKNIIEHTTRKIIWLVITNTHINIINYKGYYKNLCKNFNDCLENFKKIIDVDIIRTNHKKHDDNERRIMTRILFAFSKRNSSIGYCQGMNSIVEFFLDHKYEEEEIFWILIYLFETIIPSNYYTNMIPAMFDLKIIKFIIEKKLKKLSKHIDENQIDLTYFLFQSLILLLLNLENLLIKNIIIDYLFLNGNTIILKVIILILKNNENDLCLSKNLVEFIEKFNNILKTFDFKNEIDFKKEINKIYINSSILNYLRIKGYEKQIEKKMFSRKFKSSDKCKLNTPFCINDDNKNNIDNFIFRCDNIMSNINSKYIYNDIKKVNKNINKKENLLIIRNKHLCTFSLNDDIKFTENNKKKVKYLNDSEYFFKNTIINKRYNYIEDNISKYKIIESKIKNSNSLDIRSTIKQNTESNKNIIDIEDLEINIKETIRLTNKKMLNQNISYNLDFINQTEIN